MSAHIHAVVWIDHHEARIFHFNASEADGLVIHPDRPVRHLHHKAHSTGSGNAPRAQSMRSSAFQDSKRSLITKSPFRTAMRWLEIG